ncbi:MAG: hypothetical protein CVV32_01280 [Methanomicrobiales archaeon HGW-Methanomicrobiales-3]|nr:MAG: hypothetical protein CVV32_01280 [Methanomicrobiales archaeon HGW-Methanomicrobiales-3]
MSSGGFYAYYKAYIISWITREEAFRFRPARPDKAPGSRWPEQEKNAGDDCIDAHNLFTEKSGAAGEHRPLYKTPAGNSGGRP